MPNIAKSKINKNYNKFVIAFLVLAIIIVLFTAYFAFAKTTIYITPVPEKVSSELEISLSDINGEYITSEQSSEYVYNELAESEEVEEDYAQGTVTIYNEYVADQPLVATTRLLSKEGILFRTQDSVTVPKGGSVEVSVKADEKGEAGNISASEFEIVALNSAKKEAIYAKNESAMTGGVIGTTIVTEEELTKAKEAAKKELLDKAVEKFSEKTDVIDKENITSEIIKAETSPALGEKTNSINVNIEIKFYYTVLNKDQLLTECNQALSESKDNAYIIISQNSDKLEYVLEEKEDETLINTTCKGKAVISANTSLIKKELLTSKTKNQIEEYLNNFEEIEKVEIKFSPFWVKTTPFIKENIKIEIKDI